MSLLQQIKDDQLNARKNKDSATASLLTTLIGESAIIGKNDGNRESFDIEVLAVIKKFIKNINESLSVRENDILEAEKVILMEYMPEQIEGMRLEMTIVGIINCVEAKGIRDMGKVMKVLQEQYVGRYDGKEASTIVKEQLK